MKTISAIFDSQKDAERARNSLQKVGVQRNDVSIIGQGTGADGSAEDKGWWESIKDFFVQDEDKYAYSEGLRRGGYLLTVIVDDEDVEAATQALDQCNPIDMQGRTEEWRAEGWTPPQTQQGMSQTGQRMSQSEQGMSETDEGTEEAIPVIREELKVGKRTVNRGTIRVHARIVEEPVREDIRLREERVQVERRPTNGRATSARAAADGLEERTIEVSETTEEPVVSKEARVDEEVVVKKFVGERTEGVDDTVRHTEVDVEDDRTPANQPPPRTSKTDRSDTRRPR